MVRRAGREAECFGLSCELELVKEPLLSQLLLLGVLPAECTLCRTAEAGPYIIPAESDSRAMTAAYGNVSTEGSRESSTAAMTAMTWPAERPKHTATTNAKNQDCKGKTHARASQRARLKRTWQKANEPAQAQAGI